MIRTPILGTFFLATTDERLSGSSWYHTANAQARSIAANYRVSPSTAAGVIAALSPNNRWHRNLNDASNIIQTFTRGGVSDALDIRVCTYHTNKRKAVGILSGRDPLEVLGGLKVRSFYQLIVDPFVSGVVCVDGHAYSVWQGERITTRKAPKITPKLYDQIREDYIDTADCISKLTGRNFSASQVQAITWTVHRNLYGVGNE